jgi:hypothetical protein
LSVFAFGLTFATKISSDHPSIFRGLTLSTSVTPAPSPRLATQPTTTPTPPPAAVAVAAAKAATAGGHGRNRTATSLPLPASALTAAPPISRYGIAVGDTLPGLSAGQLATRLDSIKSLGIGWVRLDLDWNDIEYNGPGAYTWGNFDAIVNAANARGLHLLPIITYTAPWARSASCAGSFNCAPANPAQFAAFAAAAVSRYNRSGIHNWEIWNEENDTGSWQSTPSVAAYAALLKATYGQIKQIDPSATVITGGLSSNDGTGGKITPTAFLSGLYANGAGPYFDAVGSHPYSFPVTPNYVVDWNAWSQIAATNPSLYSIMSAHGDAGKKIWITEYGAPTNGPGPIATAANNNLDGSPDHVDENYQAILASDFVQAVSTSPWAGPAFWYSYIDDGTSPSTTENFYGLLRADGSQKPAFASIKQAIATHP